MRAIILLADYKFSYCLVSAAIFRRACVGKMLYKDDYHSNNVIVLLRKHVQLYADADRLHLIQAT